MPALKEKKPTIDSLMDHPTYKAEFDRRQELSAKARDLDRQISELHNKLYCDHDLPEIAECHAPRALREPLTLRLPASGRDRVSIAHCSLPAEVTSCLQQLGSELANLPHAGAHLARLERHYLPGANWGGAFAGLLAELFAEEGLVLFDPRDAGDDPAHPDLLPGRLPAGFPRAAVDDLVDRQRLTTQAVLVAKPGGEV